MCILHYYVFNIKIQLFIIYYICVSVGVRLQRSSGTVREEESGGQETCVRHRQHKLPEQMRIVTSALLQQLSVARQAQGTV